MKHILPVILCLPLLFFACKSTGSQAMSKEERQAEALAKEDALYEVAKSKQWVLEANTLYDREGASYILNTSINFVGADSTVGTIQLAFDQLVGWNGVGGITLDGDIVKYEVTRNKPGKGIDIQMTLFGSGVGTADMFINLNSEGYSTCRVNGNFGEKLSLAGQFVPLALSRVYKGMSNY